MKIDSQVEPIVRQALYGVVRRDIDIMSEALKGLPNTDAANKASQLALAITVYALHEIYGGEPSSEQINEAAEKITEHETWVTATEDEVHTFLKSTYAGTAPDKLLSADTAFYLSFVIAGSLLSGGRKDDEPWHKFLDRAEAAIEARQD